MKEAVRFLPSKTMKIEILTLNEPDICDFAKARNKMLKKARANWILFLDTDESLTPELKKEIDKVVCNTEKEGGFFIKRKIYFLGKCVGEDRVLRLATKNSGIWKRAVHETWNVNKRLGTLKEYIIHNTGKDLHSYIDKINYYSSLHAEENIKEGKKFSLFKLIIYPKAKFIQNIFAGRGFIFSLLQSYHSFLSWAKMWEIQNEK